MGKFTEYQLPLKTLTAGVHNFEFTLGKQFFENMESGDVRDADVHAQVTVDHRGDMYYLKMHVTGTIVIPCDRCLDDLQWPVDAEYDIAVKYGDAYRDDSDELLEIPDSTAALNIAYMLYDTVMLAIPMKHVHPMGKCNRQMSAVLKRHHTTMAGEDDDTATLEDQLVDEMDTMDLDNDDNTDGAAADVPTDPRWDALKGLADKQ